MGGFWCAFGCFNGPLPFMVLNETSCYPFRSGLFPLVQMSINKEMEINTQKIDIFPLFAS